MKQREMNPDEQHMVMRLARRVERRLKMIEEVAFDWEDLYQEGCIGVIRALNVYYDPIKDPYGRGRKAFVWQGAYGAMREALDQWRRSITRKQYYLRFEAWNAKRDFQNEFGREPTIAELARVLGLPENKLHAALAEGRRARSGSGTVDDKFDPMKRLADTAPGPLVFLEEVERNYTEKSRVQWILQTLSQYEQCALRLHFYDGLGFVKMGRQLGMSREGARQLVQRALQNFSVRYRAATRGENIPGPIGGRESVTGEQTSLERELAKTASALDDLLGPDEEVEDKTVQLHSIP